MVQSIFILALLFFLHMFRRMLISLQFVISNISIWALTVKKKTEEYYEIDLTRSQYKMFLFAAADITSVCKDKAMAFTVFTSL